MKQQTVFIPTRLTSKARVLAGCVVLAFSTAAFGQGDRQASDRPTDATRHESNDKTFEGKLVSLFHALQGQESRGTDPLQLNRQSGGPAQTDRAPQAGRPGSTTRPGGATQPGQPGSTTRPGDATQPGTSTQRGSADRSQGQAGLSGQDDASSLSSMGTMHMSQPLALITSDSGESSRAIEDTRSTGEGRSSTPPRASLATSPRSTTTGSPSASGTADAGELYILVFDPSDPESRSAYQMAQSIARSATARSTGAYGTQGTRDPLSSPGTTGTRQSPEGTRDLQATPGTPGATPGTDRQQDRQRNLTRPSEKTSDTGERVKITGRVIQSNGVQAIAVQKVERQHSGSTASVDRN